MSKFLLVFLGGGLGSLCRYGIALGFETGKSPFPYATFWANFISCFILGMLMAFAFKSELPLHFKLFFMVGFCGGFSTFSTFTAETFTLVQSGNYSLAAAYIITSLVVCLISLFLGLKAAALF